MASLHLKYVNSFRDRFGRQRHYFRARGMKAIALPGLPGSQEFMAAYAQALDGMSDAKQEIGASRTLPGTIDALCVDYYRSNPAWRDELEEETRKRRRRIIEKFRERHGDKRVASSRSGHVVKMLAEIEGRSARRSWFQAIRPLLQHAVPTMLRDDPTVGIPTPKLPKSDGHHSWTDPEIAQYRAHWRLGHSSAL